MFRLEYIAAALGVDVNMGGLSVAEESLQTSEGGTITLTNTPVAFDGSIIGWYRLPSQSDNEWTIASGISGNTMTIPGAQANTTYCVKYFYQNTNAKSITVIIVIVVIINAPLDASVPLFKTFDNTILSSI